jgi:hypothetical protein
LPKTILRAERVDDPIDLARVGYAAPRWVGCLVSSSMIFRSAGRDERATNVNLRGQGFCIKYLHRLWASYSQPCSQNLWICRRRGCDGVIRSDKRAGLRGAASCSVGSSRFALGSRHVGGRCGRQASFLCWVIEKRRRCRGGSAPCKVRPDAKGWSSIKPASPMTTPNRIPYFKPEKVGFFPRRTEWKKDICKPLNNPQARVLMERPPAGWKPAALPSAAAPKVEQPRAESNPGKKTEMSAERDTHGPAQQVSESKNNRAEDNDCRTPPAFDMLDIPAAMEKMGFHVAAKLARRWFDGRKHVVGKLSELHPEDMVDTTTVSLDFTLRHGRTEAKLRTLINKAIYKDVAIDALKSAMRRLVEERFIDSSDAFCGDIDTWRLSKGKIQEFHRDYQFQFIKVSDLETLSGDVGPTDLTASLGNFYYLAAIAAAKVYSEKYYTYAEHTPKYCCRSHVEITRIYVYARDSYSFWDKTTEAASQYLGHWNRHGTILVPAAVAANYANGLGDKRRNLRWGNRPDTSFMPSIYDNGFKNPVDIVKGFFRRDMRKQDVYYPIYNSSYNLWREKYNRGGDFLIYSDMAKISLSKPIQFTLEEICKLGR